MGSSAVFAVQIRRNRRAQRALTSQGRIEIQARLTIPWFASRPRSPIAAVNSMTSKFVMLASWQSHFMTSILVTNSQCVKLEFYKYIASTKDYGMNEN